MADLTLLVMAAGSGSRYGGLKQVEPLGPSGETIIDYSIFDAIKAGFDKVVFVIRRDIEDVFRDAVGRRIESMLAVHYVFQDEAMPTGSPPMVARQKPWGTAHAILSAADLIGEPFGVINADDFYGRDSFLLLGDHLNSRTQDAALVGFRLQNTLSEYGPVKRGLCAIADGRLRKVTELEHIEAEGQMIRYIAPDGSEDHLTGAEIVSMNMWGFHPTLFSYLQRKWLNFAASSGRSESAEFYIPSVVTDLIEEREGDCHVLETPSNWFGVTYYKDRSMVMQRLLELAQSDVYPKSLWDM